ncbi:glycosyltransferase family 1 protein [Chromatiaceae bacterium AAb-1]|nr:glycosyltransferase family 1 protein [Chromatiaceae bacterium AAb-1]
MKILINHLQEPANRVSGISKYLFSLLAALLQQDKHDYVLLTSWDTDKLPEVLQHPKLTVESLPFEPSLPRNILRQLRLLPRYMKKHQAVLEFNCNPTGNFTGRWPKVSVVHDLYFNIAPAAYKFHHRLWWRWFFPLTCKAASRIVCVSENTRNDLQRFYPQYAHKTQVITEGPCLPVPAQVSSDPALRQSFGLFVANVSPNKGAGTLVRAMSILNQQGRAVQVRHVGSDPVGYFKQYMAATEQGMAPVSEGYLSDEQLSRLYQQARFLAFPSQYEGFGLPVVEAQAHGTPVIASDIPVLREVAGAGALFFPLNDAQAMAEQIHQLATDDQLFQKMSEAAVANQRRFSWQQAAAETARLFEQLISDNAAEAAAFNYRRDES